MSPSGLVREEIDRKRLRDTIAPLAKEAEMLYNRKNYSASSRIWEKILVLTESSVGPNHGDTVESLRILAILYQKQGEYAKTEQLLRRALNTAQDIEGNNHTLAAEIAYDLGLFYRDTKRTEQAEVLLSKSLDLYKHNLGEESIEVAQALFSLGNLYFDTGQLQKAEPLLAKALALREARLEPDSLETAESLYYLGLLKSAIGSDDDAKKMLVRSLDIFRARLSKNHPVVASNLRILGMTFQNLEDFKQAEIYHRKALEIAENNYGKNHGEIRPFLHSLAIAQFSQKKYQDTIITYRRPISIEVDSGKPSLNDMILSNLMIGLSHELLGDFGNAEIFYLERLRLARQLSQDSDLQVVKAYNSIGSLYQKGGRLNEAERIYKRIVDLHASTLSKEARVEAAKAMSEHANVVARLGRRVEAEELFDKYYGIQSKELGQDSEETLTTQIDTALNKQALFKHAEADKILVDALSKASGNKSIGEQLADSIRILLAFNLIHSKLSEQAFDNALNPLLDNDLLNAEKFLDAYIQKHFNATLEQAATDSSLPQVNELTAIMRLLADVYVARNDFEKSITILNQAVRLVTADRKLDRNTFGIYLGLSVSYFLKDMPSNALEAAVKAEMILEETGAIESPDGINLLNFTGSILERLQKWSLYEDMAARALSATLSLLSRYFTYLPESQRDVQRTINTKIWALNIDPKTFKVEKKRALLAHRLSIKGILLEISRNQRLLAQSSQSTRDKARVIAELDSRISSIGVNSHKRPELVSKRNRLETELYKALPSFSLRVFNHYHISQQLPSDAIYIEFALYTPVNFDKSVFIKNGFISIVGEPVYMAMVLDSSGNINIQHIGSAAEIDREIANALQASAEGYEDAGDHLERVSTMLFSSLVPHLTNSQQWFVSLDGELNRVPFAALPAPQQPTKPLAQAVQLRLVTTGRELVRLQQPAPPSSSAVVMANPSYDRPGRKTVTAARPDAVSTASQRRSGDLGSSRWLPLPATEQEGKQVATLLDTRLVVGPAATTTALQRLQGPRVLHVATHGFFIADQEAPPADPLRMVQGQAPQLKALREEDPQLRSGLVLAGANQPDLDPNDDGYLTAAEAVSLDLNGTELVVLSACSTGQGEVRTGEGVYGLQRSLTVAGARSTLLSLWKVDDAATAEFMVRFYKRLKAGEGRADALAAVQAEFRSGSVRGPKGEDWSTPYHWAAWQLVGDWRPIQGL